MRELARPSGDRLAEIPSVLCEELQMEAWVKGARAETGDWLNK